MSVPPPALDRLLDPVSRSREAIRSSLAHVVAEKLATLVEDPADGVSALLTVAAAYIRTAPERSRLRIGAEAAEVLLEDVRSSLPHDPRH